MKSFYVLDRRHCTHAAIMVAVWGGLLALGGCDMGIDSSLRLQKADADFAESRARVANLYLRCLEKYQEEPVKAKEACAVYNQALLQLHVTEGSK